MRVKAFCLVIIIFAAIGNTHAQEEETPNFDLGKIIQTIQDAPGTSSWNDPEPIHRHGLRQQQLKVFGPLMMLVGKRLRGTPTDRSTERAADIQKWEWALGGTAILIRHALEDGSYGGNTYVYKDAASGDLVYVYITNAGFRTEGVILLNDDGVGYTAEEDVAGHPTITKVRSTSVINEDGSSSMTSEYLDGGNWVPGHAFNYVPTEKPLPKLIPKPAETETP